MNAEQKEWDEFLQKCGGRDSIVGFIGELQRLHIMNAIAKRELERILVAFGERDNLTRPSSWTVGGVFGATEMFGNSNPLPTEES